jgi:hypothetical protein
MIKIVCTSCQKPLSLDETKLPPNEAVSFPCPACKAKLSVDRRNLPAESAPAPAAADTRPPAYVPHDDEDGFGAKALIVGVDHPALRQAAKLIGFLPVHFPTPEQAREFYMQEYPQVVFIHPGQTSAPPLEGFQPIISLTPADRRRSFFVLFAENLRTLDGNAAFLYGVNLVVGTRDVAQFPQIYREAHAYHERLYAAMTAELKASHG